MADLSGHSLGCQKGDLGHRVVGWGHTADDLPAWNPHPVAFLSVSQAISPGVSDTPWEGASELETNHVPNGDEGRNAKNKSMGKHFPSL